MTTVATIVALAFALVVLIVAAVHVLRDQPATRAELVASGVLELGVLFYVGVRVADLVAGHRPPSLVVAIAYLVGTVLVMPVAAAIGVAERSRWGAVVFGVGAIVVAVLFARVAQVWGPRA